MTKIYTCKAANYTVLRPVPYYNTYSLYLLQSLWTVGNNWISTD
jgi:hypothetical protein